jgi:hypothetical protein
MVDDRAMPGQRSIAELLAGLDRILFRLKSASGPHAAEQANLFALAARLLQSQAGLEGLYERAHRFDDSGVFLGGPWQDPEQLQVPLVAGTLRAPGRTPVVETLSELRMLALATARVKHPAISAEDAAKFLDEVLARNLRYLLPADAASEQDRIEQDPFRASHERLFALIAHEIGIGRVLDEVVSEVEQVLAQRPISTRTVRRMIDRAYRLAEHEGLTGPAFEALQRYVVAISGPAPLASAHPQPGAYRSALALASQDELRAEADAFASSVATTGLVSPLHAVFLRHMIDAAPDLVAVALGVGEAGRVEIETHAEFVHHLVDTGVFPTTAQCIYGLGLALERSLLSRSEVMAGLERILDLEILDEVQSNLLARRDPGDPVTAQGVLVAGTIAVLGQPLGIGQGRNPTCQSARGISLWAQYDPGHLLEIIVAAARDGRVELRFSGQLVRSDLVVSGVAAELDLDLDPVSIVLVPHLDRLYSEFMRRGAFFLEDAHKWVNPALYGRWVQNELATAFADVTQTTVSDPDSFVRRFFATHHPEYNGGHRLMYPNPVGLIVTNHAGKYLGPHAVSIQRVDLDPDGVMRVYFYNPNNDGRQDWGHGVVVTVAGHGEAPGESSLPFGDFAARLYAFHYNPFEQGDLEAVDDSVVRAIVDEARESWGRRFTWTAA